MAENAKTAKGQPTRSRELRRRNRRVLAASMAVAAAIHAVVLLGFPDLRTDVPSTTEVELEGAPDLFATWNWVDATFGPPEIIAEDGTVWFEPPDRVLETQNVDLSRSRLPEACRGRTRDSVVPGSGRVRLLLAASGRVVYTEASGTSGDPCLDGLIRVVASSLWYHWLPNDRFPAPVELIQPVTLSRPEI